MTAKSVLMRPQGLRPRARAPTCHLYPSTPLRKTNNMHVIVKKLKFAKNHLDNYQKIT